MRVKVDKDLPRAAVQMLRDKGYEAVSVTEKMGVTTWRAYHLLEERGLRTANV